MTDSKVGKIQTVLGLIDSTDLGVTLAHDHVLIDGSFMYVEPEEASQKDLAHQKISLQNRGWVGYNWTSSLDNVELQDEELAVSELKRFVAAGGSSIIDPTNMGLGRDPHALARIAKLTDMHIVMGAGYYIGSTHPADMDERSEESITEEIVRDIEEGVDDTGIRAGLIGEIGCAYPWWKNEKKNVRAAAKAQKITGAPLMIHPGRDPKSPLEIIEVIAQAGGDLSRTIICHIDRTCLERSWLTELAQSGCYLEYDLFGNESSYYPPNPDVDMPSDAQRMEVILWHFENGFEKQVLLSHDVATKHRLHTYGGLGYDHLITNVMPRLRKRGLSDSQVATLIVDNPAEVYSFV
ncbi:MAG: phosphotriesterase-related protein [Saprospiraceae bacterium]|jgi:phosphotriesterase-related protein